MAWEKQPLLSETTGKTPATVFPGEDWDAAAAATPLPSRPGGTDWCPVFVQLARENGTFARSAEKILDKLGIQKRDDVVKIAAGLDTQRQLQRLKSASPGIDHLSGLFLYRPASQAYWTYIDDSRDQFLTVCHVGPRITRTAIARSAFEKTIMGAPRYDGVPLAPPAPITAIIDDSFSFLHERFRECATSTRVQRFWSMQLERIGSSDVAFGKSIDKAGIDHILCAFGHEGNVDESVVYRRFDAPWEENHFEIEPRSAVKFRDPDFRRPRAFADSHGTHVGDLAAGAPVGARTAESHPIVAVELPHLATLETTGDRLDAYVLQAVIRVLDWADTLNSDNGSFVPAPVVINLSYGVSAGRKDGFDFLEAAIRRLAKGRSNLGHPTRVVLPTGNSYRSRGRALVELPPGNSQSVDWRVQPDDRTVSFLEVWFDTIEKAQLIIRTPGEKAQKSFNIGPAASTYDYKFKGKLAGRLYIQKVADLCGNGQPRWRATFALAPTTADGYPGLTAPPGAYVITVANGNQSGEVLRASIEVQRDDTPSGYPSFGRQSYLDSADIDAFDAKTGRRDAPGANGVITREGTMSAYATVESDEVFVVGAAFGDKGRNGAQDEPALYAGAGPTPGKHTPDLAAVSETSRAHGGTLAAGTFSGSAAIFSGSSSAAPQITRLLVESLRDNPNRSKQDIIDALLGNVPNPMEAHQLGQGVVRRSPPEDDRPARRLAK